MSWIGSEILEDINVCSVVVFILCFRFLTLNLLSFELFLTVERCLRGALEKSCSEDFYIQ